MALCDTRFIDETHVGAEMPADVVFISGGDTSRLASSIGSSRLDGLEHWIVDGGICVGICAGAYLSQRSSLPPLCNFNLVRSRIRNLSKNLPRSVVMEKKFSAQYGCSHVFHPVRGPLEVDFGGNHLVAPLCGGSYQGDSGLSLLV